jgi:hypothetical protein
MQTATDALALCWGLWYDLSGFLSFLEKKMSVEADEIWAILQNER